MSGELASQTGRDSTQYKVDIPPLPASRLITTGVGVPGMVVWEPGFCLLSSSLCSHLHLVFLHREPVTRDEAEDYYDIITQPMDFQTMQNKCSCGSYRSVQEFLTDMKQVFTNAELYNCRGSHVLNCMVKTEQCLVALLHKHLPGHPYVRRKRKKFPDRLAEDEGDSESEPVGQSRGRRQKK